MNIEVLLLTKSISAQTTNMQLYLAIGKFVVLQVLQLSKFLSPNIARERCLNCVTPHMNPQIVAPINSLPQILHVNNFLMTAIKYFPLSGVSLWTKTIFPNIRQFASKTSSKSNLWFLWKINFSCIDFPKHKENRHVTCGARLSLQQRIARNI